MFTAPDKLLLLTNLSYYGDDPYEMSLLYFSLAQASYIGGGGHFIKGGSQKLSDYLASYIECNGGQVLLGKKVENILVENDKACGVTFRDTFNISSNLETVYADNIIANAAIPLVADMLPSSHNQAFKSKIKDYQESCSLISIYMGFDVDLKEFGVEHYSTFVLGDEVTCLGDLKENFRGDWAKKGFVFIDYSQVDSELAPKGKSVGVLCTTDYLSEWQGLDQDSYRAKKEEIAKIFFRKLDALYPGIMKHLVLYDVGTAKTIQRYTLNPKGAPYGYAQTVGQSGLKRLPVESPIKNLYFASAWVFPGSGFTGTILSGFLCAMEMNKKLKWSTLSAEKLNDGRVMRLVESKIIADNTIELIFEKPSCFNHKAGQYAIVKLNHPITNHLDMPFRSLSITSHTDENTLHFAIRLSESSYKKSCAALIPGNLATIFEPTGQFALPEGNEKNIVFLIAGIGITPVLPMLKELEKRQHQGKVVLFYTNRTESSAAYHEVFQNSSLKTFSYIPVITSKNKRIDIELLKSQLIDLKDVEFYLVGTTPFLKSMKEILIKENVDRLKIKEDDFG